MADIEPISENIEWSSEACAADALNRVKPTNPFIAIWIDEQGEIHYSQANITFTSLAVFSAQLAVLLNNYRK